ncbi:MAG: hypothetical protein OEN56_10490 [Gemmatimonadota bacterium]|nr:hypothetical protein [Gemmatimonadota bacterium]
MRKPPSWRRALVTHSVPFLAILTFLCPGDANAQLGAIEAFARRVTDLSFNAHLGGLSPASDEVRADAFGLRSFGLELLFEIGTVDEVTGPAPTVTDTVALAWTEMVVVVGEDGVDTTYVYEVAPAPTPAAPTRTIWTFEMGLGYGQTFGFESPDPDIDLRGQVRDLPAASLYASYEPVGFYIGLRSGFMRIQGLQAFDAAGDAFSGKSESFLLAALVGNSVEVLGLNIFLEAAYSVRSFPSVEWRAVQSSVPVNLDLPRELSLSGWSVGTGVQFKIGS